MVRSMTIKDYEDVYALWMQISGFAMRSIDDSKEGVERFLKRNPKTSVVAVEVAPDLKSCKAWISVLGNEEARNATYQGLRSAEGFIKSKLAKEINLRNTPAITFIMDQSIEYGVSMSKKIDDVMASERVEEEEE